MASPNVESCLRFGEFEIWPAAGDLKKNGLPVRLQPQPFRVLVLLMSRPGTLVAREEIRQELWGTDTTVEFDQGLNFCIRQIRAVLGDDSREPRFVETVPKRGYRFIAEVTHPDSAVDSSSAPLISSADSDEVGPSLAPKAHQDQAGTLPITHTLPKINRPWSQIAIAGLFLALIAGWGASMLRNAVPGKAKSIVVRPFVGLGLPAEDAWLADALTSQLITSLGESVTANGEKALRVIPWSSVLTLKEETLTAKQIGERFDANFVLEGSLSRIGDRLRLNTQLIDAKSASVSWSHTDEHEARDLARLQDDVTGALAAALEFRVSSGDTPTSRRRPEDPETYNLYLQAQYYGDQYTASGFAKSAELFEEVIRRAPNYAPAYSGLANTLTTAQFAQQPGPQRPPEFAMETAQKAIELDPSLAPAHAALAHGYFLAWKWEEARKEFEIAVRLDPDSAMAHQLYGIFLTTHGDGAPGVSHEERAAALAPTSALISFSLAQVYLHTGRYDDAIAQARHTLDLNPHLSGAYGVIARSYTMKGMTSAAMEVIREWERVTPNPFQNLWSCYTLASGGQREQAAQALERWRAKNLRSEFPPYPVAAALMGMGDRDGALNAITKAVDRHVPGIIWLKVSPEIAPLRNDPRFLAALSKMNLN